MDWERIKDRMETLGLSQAELARRVGLTQGAIQQIVSGTTLRSRKLPEIAVQLGVSVPYLLGDTDDPDPHFFKPPVSEEDVLDQAGVVKVPEVEITFGMGGGSFFEEYVEERSSVFDASWLRSITDSPASLLFIARGVGDSMMPTLMDSDTLLIDRAQQRLQQQDRIWALSYGDVGMIKRVRSLPQGRFLIMSDNTSVSDFEASADEIYFIGRVAWVGRKI